MTPPNHERAAAIRAIRGLTSQEEFAERIGVSRITVIKLEQGTTPSLSTARELVALGLDIEHVLPTQGTPAA